MDALNEKAKTLFREYYSKINRLIDFHNTTNILEKALGHLLQMADITFNEVFDALERIDTLFETSLTQEEHEWLKNKMKKDKEMENMRNKKKDLKKE